MTKIWVCFLYVLVFSIKVDVYAQDSGGASGGGGGGAGNLIESSVQDLSVVAGTGIAGAVLGLSTLSFVQSPKAHMRNILIGGSIGIIIGVSIIAYTQATKSHERIFKSSGGADGANKQQATNLLLESVKDAVNISPKNTLVAISLPVLSW